jgi:hypothetical protein
MIHSMGGGCGKCRADQRQDGARDPSGNVKHVTAHLINVANMQHFCLLNSAKLRRPFESLLNACNFLCITSPYWKAKIYAPLTSLIV